MNNPKISVIIPVYNVESYLRECLDSIVNQTFRDLEIICINDGSTDGSLAILEEYASKDRRFQIVTKENGGQAECRNIGISMASGEYIQFVDSDDYLDLNACQTIYSKAVETQSDMVMFLFHFFGKFEKRSLDDVKFIPSELTSNYDKIWFEFNNAQVVWANLFRRDFLDNNNIRFHNGLYFEDVPFVAKASLLAKRISVIPCPLYYYRQRENSTMNNKQKKELHIPSSMLSGNV
ncbi:MAG: glycosyltransferase [Thermoguttaceae bacterium]|nr:glycosyltransferase [Thermoguttaceae bacterium]